MKTLQKLMCTADVSQVIQQFSRISRWSTQPPCAEPVATVLKEGDSDANNLHTNLTWWITKSSCSYTVTSWCCKYPTKLPVFKQFQMVIPVRFYTPTVSFKFKFLDFVHLKGGTSHQNTLRRKKKKTQPPRRRWVNKVYWCCPRSTAWCHPLISLGLQLPFGNSETSDPGSPLEDRVFFEKSLYIYTYIFGIFHVF